MRRHEAEVPWGSFADALSGVLFVFILTTFWFAYQLQIATEQAYQQQIQAAEKTRVITEARETARALTRQEGGLTQCLRRNGWVEPEPYRDEARLALYLPGVEWFDIGKASLDTPAREGAAAEIRECIGKLVDRQELKDKYQIRVSLEGHTDSQRYRDGDSETNWELSGRRAAAVVRRVLDGNKGSITEAVENDRLQVLSTGLADRQPAWNRICDQKSQLAAADRAVCDALLADSPGLDSLLADPELYAFDEHCAPRSVDGSASRSERLRMWANRCPDPAGDTGNARRGLLRRVDLRLELVPLLEGSS
jgi:outer membrane protein OmpA-like peptidoglycan-associated protein